MCHDDVVINYKWLMNGVFELLCCALLRLVQAVYFVNGSNLQSTPAVMRQLRLKKVKRNDNLYSGVSNRSHIKAAVQRQPQVRTMLEWRRLAANRKVRRMAASIPNTAPMVHFTPSRSRYQFILLGEQRHMCVNNLPRVAHVQRRNSRESNSQPLDHESDALPLHHQATQHGGLSREMKCDNRGAGCSVL